MARPKKSIVSAVAEVKANTEKTVEAVLPDNSDLRVAAEITKLYSTVLDLSVKIGVQSEKTSEVLSQFLSLQSQLNTTFQQLFSRLAQVESNQAEQVKFSTTITEGSAQKQYALAMQKKAMENVRNGLSIVHSVKPTSEIVPEPAPVVTKPEFNIQDNLFSKFDEDDLGLL